jgi:hypothetical protein
MLERVLRRSESHAVVCASCVHSAHCARAHDLGVRCGPSGQLALFLAAPIHSSFHELVRVVIHSVDYHRR